MVGGFDFDSFSTNCYLSKQTFPGTTLSPAPPVLQQLQSVALITIPYEWLPGPGAIGTAFDGTTRCIVISSVINPAPHLASYNWLR